jgi:hypothetical protein
MARPDEVAVPSAAAGKANRRRWKLSLISAGLQPDAQGAAASGSGSGPGDAGERNVSGRAAGGSGVAAPKWRPQKVVMTPAPAVLQCVLGNEDIGGARRSFSVAAQTIGGGE